MFHGQYLSRIRGGGVDKIAAKIDQVAPELLTAQHGGTMTTDGFPEGVYPCEALLLYSGNIAESASVYAKKSGTVCLIDNQGGFVSLGQLGQFFFIQPNLIIGFCFRQ